MIRALNPINRKYVTVTEFLAEIGPNYKKKGVIPECPCNGCELYIHGAHSPKSPARFSHMPNQNEDCRCRKGYDGPLGVPGYDSLLLKDKFCKEENLKKIYKICLDACGARKFPASKYIELVKKANQINIWGYVGLEIWMLPYILLTLDDFRAKDKNGKEYEYRFILLEDSNLDLLAHINDIKISKIFADSQKEIKQFSINKEKYDETDTSWMPENLIQSLLSVC